MLGPARDTAAGLHQLLRPVRERAVGLPAFQRDALDAAFGLTREVAPEPRAKVIASLETLKRREGILFPAAGGGRIDINNWRTREWTPALKAAGVEHRRIYDMRHTFATWSLAAGMSIFTLARRMGTSVPVIDATYGHLAIDADGNDRVSHGRGGFRTCDLSRVNQLATAALDPRNPSDSAGRAWWCHYRQRGTGYLAICGDSRRFGHHRTSLAAAGCGRLASLAPSPAQSRPARRIASSDQRDT